MTDERTQEETDDDFNLEVRDRRREVEGYINRVSTNDRACLNARLGTSNVREAATTTVVCCTDHGENIITPHASQLQTVLATFKCNTITSDFSRQLQCLIPPTEL